jgi:uncharacterized protein (DUF1778 family)
MATDLILTQYRLTPEVKAEVAAIQKRFALDSAAAAVRMAIHDFHVRNVAPEALEIIPKKSRKRG